MTIWRTPQGVPKSLFDNKLQWRKNAKDIRICSLHFEPKCFKGKRIDWRIVAATLNAINSDGSISLYAPV